MHELSKSYRVVFLFRQEEMVYAKETQTRKTFTEILAHGIKTDKKWSTFLMKPDKPIPKTMRIVEQEKTQVSSLPTRITYTDF